MDDSIEVKPAEQRFAPVPARRHEVELRRVDDEILLCDLDRVYPVAGVDNLAQAKLCDVVDGGQPMVVWVAQAGAERATLNVRRYPSALHLPEPLEIGIDDRCLGDLRQRFGVSGTVADIARWIEEHLLLPGGGNRCRAVISAGPRDSKSAFRMFGKGLAIDVRRAESRLFIEHIVKNAPTDRTSMRLLVASLRFADLTATGELASGARHALEEAVRAQDSYLRIWQTYAGMDREAILRRARRVGSLRYERRERRADGGFRFYLADVDELEARLSVLDDGDRFELEAGSRPPSWESLESPPGFDRKNPPLVAPVARVDAERRTVDLRAKDENEGRLEPPEQGFLYLSVVGDRARLRRREEAEERLRTGNCKMPWLGLLLEGRPAAKTTYRRRPADSAAVRATFGGRPTHKQLAAIEVALNTPDIALIQGPPGTGKTRVITALQRRLAELTEEGAEVSHRILVSSAQHDAVENVVQRSEVFGLPAVKIGARRGDDGAVIDGVEKFRADRIEQLRATLVEPPEEERSARARRIAVACLRAPAPPVKMAGHLRELAEIVAGLVPPSLHDQLERRLTELDRPSFAAADSDERALRVAAARGIRVTPASFEDDGP
ncbi:MAG: AAA domain-containing protein, partial [Minicystis sp.]